MWADEYFVVVEYITTILIASIGKGKDLLRFQFAYTLQLFAYLQEFLL